MPKYVCTGSCGGSSDVPGTCQTEGCGKHGQELQQCTCDTGTCALHGGEMEQAPAETPSEEPAGDQPME